MKFLTYNINRAAQIRKKLWEFLEKEYPWNSFDVGVFQEVYFLPCKLNYKYDKFRSEMKATLIKRDFVDKENIKNEKLMERSKDINREVFSLICGLSDAHKIKVEEKELYIINIYNYMYVSKYKEEKIFEKFLEKALYPFIEKKSKDCYMIIAGDFNMNTNFKTNPTWKNLMIRMEEKFKKFGLKEAFEDEKIITYISPNKKKEREGYQLDYVFYSKSLKVNRKWKGKLDWLYEKELKSDHLPLMVEFEL